jgi:2-oxoglutarate ferredoxin oxidoreductase subunit delta
MNYTPKIIKSVAMEVSKKLQSLPKERKVKGKVEIEIQKCKGCELCTDACKENALSLSNTINAKGYRYVVANNDLCTGCVNCALVCPDAVITVYRTRPGSKAKENITPTDKEELKKIITENLPAGNNTI